MFLKRLGEADIKRGEQVAVKIGKLPPLFHLSAAES
jgi:hypothetical protein